ncbi:MAG: chorismate pyruvate-lyase family protein [Rhizobacter sp.]
MSVDRHPFPPDARHAALLRVLLALDGSTTRVCEAVAQSPMTVQLLLQEQTDDVPPGVREQLGGTRWLKRVTSLHAFGPVLMDNLSYTRLDAVPDWFLAQLNEGTAPIGHLLQRLFVKREALASTPEIQQALWQHVGQPDLRASRSYRIVTEAQPLMLIFETFRSGMVASA